MVVGYCLAERMGTSTMLKGGGGRHDSIMIMREVEQERRCSVKSQDDECTQNVNDAK